MRRLLSVILPSACSQSLVAAAEATPAARSTRRCRCSRRTRRSPSRSTRTSTATSGQGARQAAGQVPLQRPDQGAACKQQLEQSSGGVSFEDDIKPVLGNPLVVGASGQRVGDVVAAIKAKDKGKLDDLISKTKAQKTGEASGATLYKDGNTVFAVKDDLVVFANNEAQLKSALARADGDDHLDENTFNEGLSGLPDTALARMYVNVEALLKSDPEHGGRAPRQVDRRATPGGRDGDGEGQRDRHRLPRAHRGRPLGRRPADRLGRRGAAGDQAAAARSASASATSRTSSTSPRTPARRSTRPASATTSGRRRRSTSSSG